MYFVGQVPCQNLLDTLRQLITSPSPTTGKPYWRYIGTTSTDGAYQSTDGNNVIVRIANAGVGLALAIGTYAYYIPGPSQGVSGTFGPGDYQLIFYYAGNCCTDGNVASYTYSYIYYDNNYGGYLTGYSTTQISASYYPFISDAQNGQPIPSIAGKIGGYSTPYQPGEYRPGFQFTPSTAPTGRIYNAPETQNGNLVALPPTAMVNYWLVVTKSQIVVVLQGDPLYSNSITQMGAAGLLNKWNQEPGNWASFSLATQWKMYGNDPSDSDQGGWGIHILRDRNGNWNQYYSAYIPQYNFTVPQNVWTNGVHLSPISVYKSNEGYRGDIPGLAFMTSNKNLSGDEFIVVDQNGVTQTWKHFVLQINTLYYNQTMLPSLSVAILEDNS